LGSLRREQIPGQILVRTAFRDEKFYTFFIKKFFLTLYIGQHKDNQAQLAQWLPFNRLDAQVYYC